MCPCVYNLADERPYLGIHRPGFSSEPGPFSKTVTSYILVARGYLDNGKQGS